MKKLIFIVIAAALLSTSALASTDVYTYKAPGGEPFIVGEGYYNPPEMCNYISSMTWLVGQMAIKGTSQRTMDAYINQSTNHSAMRSRLSNLFHQLSKIDVSAEQAADWNSSENLDKLLHQCYREFGYVE